MNKKPNNRLSRREREIMDVVYQLGEASVAEVVEKLTDNPSYDTIRVTLGILTQKGHLQHRRESRRYIYRPTVSRQAATRSAVRSLTDTFFNGSPTSAILAMIDMSSEKLNEDDLARIAELIEREKDK